MRQERMHPQHRTENACVIICLFFISNCLVFLLRQCQGTQRQVTKFFFKQRNFAKSYYLSSFPFVPVSHRTLSDPNTAVGVQWTRQTHCAIMCNNENATINGHKTENSALKMRNGHVFWNFCPNQLASTFACCAIKCYSILIFKLKPKSENSLLLFSLLIILLFYGGDGSWVRVRAHSFRMPCPLFYLLFSSTLAINCTWCKLSVYSVINA